MIKRVVAFVLVILGIMSFIVSEFFARIGLAIGDYYDRFEFKSKKQNRKV